MYIITPLSESESNWVHCTGWQTITQQNGMLVRLGCRVKVKISDCKLVVKSIVNGRLDRMRSYSRLEERQTVLKVDHNWQCMPESDGFGEKKNYFCMPQWHRRATGINVGVQGMVSQVAQQRRGKTREFCTLQQVTRQAALSQCSKSHWRWYNISVTELVLLYLF